MVTSSRNLTRHAGLIDPEARAAFTGQRGAVVWLTGLSASGKSTIASALELRLLKAQHLGFVLDGDTVRQGLNKDLGFSPDDRRENIRRIGEVAALFADAGLVAITAFISPYRADRVRARETAGSKRFVEVYLDVPVSVCEQRDPKGLYRRARAGEIPQFTGVSAPYEAPQSPEIALDTDALDVDTCVDRVFGYLLDRQFIGGGR